MSTSTVGLFLRHLALSEEVSRLDNASDRDLLAAHEAEQGQAPFTELMRRHGPMVLRTCRRVLGHSPDAEDAFQATFVLLARKASRLRGETAGRLSLGGWLHRVAYQTALNARSRLTRRRVHERQASPMSHPDPDPAIEATWNEVRPILDAELNALPDEARRLLIACDLQGKTHAEAAAQLDLPLGSLARRLEKARALLAERLARRGITLSATLLAVLLGESARGARVPAVLLVHTVETARTFTEQATGMVSENVARLVKGGLANMAKGSTHWSMVLVGWVGLLGAGLIACQTLKAWPEPTPATGEPAATERPAQEEKQTRVDRHGDPLPPGALTRLGTLRLRHNAAVRSLVFTPDGKGLLTAGGDNLPRLWDAATGKLLREFTTIPKPQWIGDKCFVASPAILSPDGRLLAVRGGPRSNLYLLETATGKRRHEFFNRAADDVRNDSLFLNFAFSPDGKAIAAQLAGRLELRDVATGRTLWQQNEKYIVALAFSADGKTLASSANGDGVRLWDARTGKLLREVVPKCVLAHIAFSPDGRTLAVGGVGAEDREHRNSVHLWDVATGRKVRQLSAPADGQLDQCYYYPIFSPDGKIVAAKGKKGICLWEAATGKELPRWPDVPFHWSPLAFSPDGKILAALDGLLVRCWDAASGKARSFRLPPGHESAVSSLAFTADGQTLVSSGQDHTVRWWDATSGQQRLCLPGPKDLLWLSGVPNDPRVRRTCTSALSPDGTMLAATSVEAPDADLSAEETVKRLRAGIRLLDAATGKELRRLDSGNGWAAGLTFAPDGKMLAEAFGSANGRRVARLWDVASGKRQSEVAGTCPLFSPDGSFLVTHNNFKMVHFWETATGKGTNAIRANERIQCLALSPDGKTLAVGSDRITLYPLSRDKQSGVRVGSSRQLASSLGFVTALAFSLDGRMLASSGRDHAIHLWETASGKERARLHGHSLAPAILPTSSWVAALSFTADGRRLASGSVDSTILIWDVTGRLEDGRLRGTLLSAKQLEGYWSDLAGDDAARAGRAIWALAADPARSVPFLAEQLRTAAADTKAQLPRVPQLIRDLDDDAFPVREQAKTELARLGAAVEPALRQALAKSPSLETRRSLEQLLEAVEAKRQAPTGELLRAVRTLEVLEQIGTREARATLKSLTAGAGVEFSLTQEAQAVLERLEQTKRR